MSSGRSVTKTFLAAVLAMLVLAPGAAAVAADRQATYAQLKLFTDVLAIIQQQYVDETEPRDMIYGAIRGMLGALDPDSSFLDPETYREMQRETSGSVGAVGLEITIRDEQLTVVTPLEGSPAWRAGIQPGDRIVKFDGMPTRGMALAEGVRRMRGPRGSQTTLALLREGSKEPVDVTLTREIVRVQNVEGQEIEPGLGYVRIRQFHGRTAPELDAALAQLGKTGRPVGVILDLRSNPGGLLSAAVEVAEQFLADGTLVVYTTGRVRSQNMRFLARPKQPLTTVPLVVLVNGGSAAASEIVAGAIQDHGRGVILGQPTFGRGSIQTIIPLSDGSGLRLTTARFFAPKGRSIHGQGITPDIVVEAPPEDPLSRSLPKTERLRRDPQLQRAIGLLKAN